MIAILTLLAAVLLLLAEDHARRRNKARARYLEGWISRHYRGSGESPYDLERAYDTRKAGL